MARREGKLAEFGNSTVFSVFGIFGFDGLGARLRCAPMMLVVPRHCFGNLLGSEFALIFGMQYFVGVWLVVHRFVGSLR
jgi:hypothetical protein